MNASWPAKRPFLTIPIDHGAWILLGGGGGISGNRYGEAGARIMLSGNGGDQSLFLKVVAGFAWLEIQSSFFSHAGPMLGVGLDWRM